MRFSVYQESLIGGRKMNQDRMGYSYTRDSILLLLADGMGGHVRGEMAASIAMQTIGSMFQTQAQPLIGRPERFFEEAFFAAHQEIHRYREAHNLPETPRTTVVACLIENGYAYWAHCGDSRLYWMRNGEILLRTKDHSRLEVLIDQGKVDPSERMTHPDRNKLFNCLGAPNPPIVELSRRATLQAGDLLMLCSDGLWGVLPDHMMAQHLKDHTIVRAIPELIRTAANIAGKQSDNVTALALMWEGDGNLDNTTIISTKTVPVGSITTTIQAPLDSDQPEQEASPADIFNETEIEKTIEEIRVAIQKTSRISSKA
jgi:PPM family protein phosphatase